LLAVIVLPVMLPVSAQSIQTTLLYFMQGVDGGGSRKVHIRFPSASACGD
jgi:hypothetical protein